MNLEQIKTNFENHILTPVLETDDLKVFSFRKPDTNHHAQRWIIDRGTLIVQGDNGAAVYSWNNRGVSLEFLANCNLGYFSEKCLADRQGWEQNEFVSEDAEEILKTIAVETLETELEEEDRDALNWETKSLEEKIEFFKDEIINDGDFHEYEFQGLFHFEREADAFDFMNRSENAFLFGSDAWEHKLRTKTFTPFFHLAALQVANEKSPGAF
jgi:hypothetical protein